MINWLSVVVGVLLLHLMLAANSQIPSLNEIHTFDDPELNDIFGTVITTNRPPEPQPSKPLYRWQSQQPPKEIPIEHNRGFVPIPTSIPLSAQQGVRELAKNGAEVFITGAEAFVSGAQRVGNAFAASSGDLFDVGRALLG